MNKLSRLLKILYHFCLRRSTSLEYLPEHISIEVTNSCNFKCVFCIISSRGYPERVSKKSLSVGEAEIILKKIRASGAGTNVIRWTLGGEPFLNNEFSRISAVAVENGFTNQLFATNGVLMTPERLSTFPSDNVRYKMTVDFSSDKAGFETFRGSKGSWDVIKENIGIIGGDPAFSRFQILISDISNYWIGDKVMLSDLHKKLRVMFRAARVKITGFRKFHNMLGYLGTVRDKTDRKYHVCPYPWVTFHIASNGDVVSCCRDLEHRTILGNIFKQGLGEIWNGPKYQTLRRSLVAAETQRLGACGDCDMPYDASRFNLKNIARYLRYRLLVFSK